MKKLSAIGIVFGCNRFFSEIPVGILRADGSAILAIGTVAFAEVNGKLQVNKFHGFLKYDNDKLSLNMRFAGSYSIASTAFIAATPCLPDPDDATDLG